MEIGNFTRNLVGEQNFTNRRHRNGGGNVEM